MDLKETTVLGSLILNGDAYLQACKEEREKHLDSIRQRLAENGISAEEMCEFIDTMSAALKELLRETQNEE